MNILVGSKNPIKIEAVREFVQDYELFNNFEVVGCDLSYELLNTDIPSQPKNLSDIVKGSMFRAQRAFEKGSLLPRYGVGIESGLIEIPHSRFGMFNFCACQFYNGIDYALGFSGGFEIPKIVENKIKNEDKEISDVCFELGLTDHSRVGYDKGFIGVLSYNETNRKEYTKEALSKAVLKLRNSLLYERNS